MTTGSTSYLLGMPRPESKFVDSEGRISRDWFMFLSYLLQQLGGPPVTTSVTVTASDIQQQFEEYPLTNPDAVEALRGVDELRNTIDSTRSELQSLRSVLDEHTAALEAIRSVTDYRNRIESLEDRLA